MNSENQHPRLDYLAISILLLAFFGYYAVQVWDIDFWGHIAAGREIVASGSIPDTDFFGVYGTVDIWGQTVLKSQWLGQVLLYWVHDWFGLDGIILLRAALLTGCLLIVYLRCRIAEATPLFTLSIVTLSGLVLLLFTGERPQLFSFLYLALAFLLLDLYASRGSYRALYPLPLLILLWANTHGAVLFGVGVVILFLGMLLLETRLQSGRFDHSRLRMLLLIAVLCGVAALVTPNGLHTLTSSLKFIIFPQHNPIHDRISEYAPPWKMWPATIYYWIFFAVFLLSLPGLYGKQHLRHSVVAVAVALFSLTGSRYAPLFVLLAAPYVAASLSRLLAQRLPSLPRAVPLATMVIAAGFLVYGFATGRVFQHGLSESRFPVQAVSYLRQHQLGGRIFNAMNWGGYLIWNLPAVQVFIDGRTLDTTRLVPYTHILWMTPEGQQFLDRANFDLVLIPPANPFSGERYPLVDYLRRNPAWRLLDQSRTGFLFARIRY